MRTLHRDIHEQMVTLLKARKYSRYTVAKMCGADPATVQRWANRLGIGPTPRRVYQHKAPNLKTRHRRQGISVYPWLFKGARTDVQLKAHRLQLEKDCWPKSPQHIQALRQAAKQYDHWRKTTALAKPRLAVDRRAA